MTEAMKNFTPEQLANDAAVEGFGLGHLPGTEKPLIQQAVRVQKQIYSGNLNAYPTDQEIMQYQSEVARAEGEGMRLYDGEVVLFQLK